MVFPVGRRQQISQTPPHSSRQRNYYWTLQVGKHHSYLTSLRDAIGPMVCQNNKKKKIDIWIQPANAETNMYYYIARNSWDVLHETVKDTYCTSYFFSLGESLLLVKSVGVLKMEETNYIFSLFSRFMRISHMGMCSILLHHCSWFVMVFQKYFIRSILHLPFWEYSAQNSSLIAVCSSRAEGKVNVPKDPETTESGHEAGGPTQ